jgi:hypothetical protein
MDEWVDERVGDLCTSLLYPTVGLQFAFLFAAGRWTNIAHVSDDGALILHSWNGALIFCAIVISLASKEREIIASFF